MSFAVPCPCNQNSAVNSGAKSLNTKNGGRMLYEGLLVKEPPAAAGAEIPGQPLSKTVLGSGLGALTGIIGLGGGYALVPSYIYFLNAPVRLAIGTSMAAFVWMALKISAAASP
jgi:hypothetical protein